MTGLLILFGPLITGVNVDYFVHRLRRFTQIFLMFLLSTDYTDLRRLNLRGLTQMIYYRIILLYWRLLLPKLSNSPTFMLVALR